MRNVAGGDAGAAAAVQSYINGVACPQSLPAAAHIILPLSPLLLFAASSFSSSQTMPFSAAAAAASREEVGDREVVMVAHARLR